MDARILTPRLKLARWSAHDATDLRRVLDAEDAHLRPWIPFMATEPRSLAQTTLDMATWRAHFDQGRSFRYGIWVRASAALAGEVLVFHREPEDPDLELGYWLARSFMGQGYALEAVQGLLAALKRRGVERVWVQVDARNGPSLALARRLGAAWEEDRLAPGLGGDRSPVRLRSGWISTGP